MCGPTHDPRQMMSRTSPVMISICALTFQAGLAVSSRAMQQDTQRRLAGVEQTLVLAFKTTAPVKRLRRSRLGPAMNSISAFEGRVGNSPTAGVVLVEAVENHARRRQGLRAVPSRSLIEHRNQVWTALALRSSRCAGDQTALLAAVSASFSEQSLQAVANPLWLIVTGGHHLVRGVAVVTTY